MRVVDYRYNRSDSCQLDLKEGHKLKQGEEGENIV